MPVSWSEELATDAVVDPAVSVVVTDDADEGEAAATRVCLVCFTGAPKDNDAPKAETTKAERTWFVLTWFPLVGGSGRELPSLPSERQTAPVSLEAVCIPCVINLINNK